MFVLSSKKLSFIDVVYTTELCAFSLEKENQIENTELLPQKK